MALKDGQVIDSRYRISARLGEGGMADVYEAFDIVFRRSVAVKFIKEEAMISETNLTRFENEATIAASLYHPNIVKVLGHGVHEGRPYIVEELIQGKTLKEILEIRSPLPLSECLDIMLQVTSAMGYAHQKGVIHRDIKPQNIFIEADGTVKIGDFGISEAAGLTTRKSSDIKGSVHYLAPEITQGKPASIQSDIYAIGVTFFEMVTGHPPFNKKKASEIALAHVNEKFPSPKIDVPTLPSEIEKIILTATEKKPNKRYKSAWHMNEDIKKFVNRGEKPVKKGLFKKK
ncbi:MAG: serine/threonine protein kinase [Coprobacillus sp.]|nr:serine/threonine protein kinase [Coprobacillus sp.]